MSVEQNRDEIIAACRDKLAARDRVVKAEQAVTAAKEESARADDAARTRRDAALWRLVREDGIPVGQVPEKVRGWLVAAGFTSDQIEGLGVSYGAVRLAVGRPR